MLGNPGQEPKLSLLSQPIESDLANGRSLRTPSPSFCQGISSSSSYSNTTSAYPHSWQSSSTLSRFRSWYLIQELNMGPTCQNSPSMAGLFCHSSPLPEYRPCARTRRPASTFFRMDYLQSSPWPSSSFLVHSHNLLAITSLFANPSSALFPVGS
ncbi:uncharacterized protein MYCFIDRAFT_174901 [Pseudocercospora fijiensis CIRAD86]|uniref:Uncharacterized protein n=1 Tax=Pseudocercospora fijiensis (strain CIRAD86) TaxID=383855 RepID=M3AFV7_PSEFD|nr:uncharacterized protein MYCFIDRAFT_174901 [Pseudocercospora fijiensis CIRAD86]EME83476.1 hypothetical protein MYCFIDRAFT_174901 [Pseudocercospora fijiensis CIRAD86]